MESFTNFAKRGLCHASGTAGFSLLMPCVGRKPLCTMPPELGIPPAGVQKVKGLLAGSRP